MNVVTSHFFEKIKFKFNGVRQLNQKKKRSKEKRNKKGKEIGRAAGRERG